jgi:hypothetical protein
MWEFQQVDLLGRGFDGISALKPPGKIGYENANTHLASPLEAMMLRSMLPRTGSDHAPINAGANFQATTKDIAGGLC